jgi:hypothetical protein
LPIPPCMFQVATGRSPRLRRYSRRVRRRAAVVSRGHGNSRGENLR